MLAALVAGACACSSVPGGEGEGATDESAVTAGGTVVGLAGKCLDARSGATADGTPVQLFRCNGTAAQIWTLSNGALIGPGGKCLDVRNASAQNGAAIQLWTCTGGANQRWKVVGNELVGLGGKCLDVTGATSADGTPIELWDCWNGGNQRWTLAAPASPVGGSTPLPRGDLPGWRQILAEDFSTTAPSGAAFLSAYAGSWCSYDDSTQYRRANLSASGGQMVVTLDGKTGAAGVWAPGGCDTAWTGETYGRYSFRFKAVGASGNGTAVMVWPTSNIWGDGEIDYPEGSFQGDISVNHHGVGCGSSCGAADSLNTGVGFQDWHIATVEWVPGKVTYLLDGNVVKTVTHDVPTTPHRFTIQMAPTSSAPQTGKFLVDWVAIYARD